MAGQALATPAELAAAHAEIDAICRDIQTLRRAEIAHEAQSQALPPDLVKRRRTLMQRLDAAEAIVRQAGEPAGEPDELTPTQQQNAWPRY